MAASYVPSLKGFATTNHPGATGDGILLAEKVGADFVDMKEIQTHPTYAPGKEMITEAVRGNGAILVNKGGDRFVDELKTRDVVSAPSWPRKARLPTWCSRIRCAGASRRSRTT
jgi:fumarate reductase flavoprotein subunit